MKYFYTQVSGGYRWNMLQRILNTIGIEPIASGDVNTGSGVQTYLEFSRDLTDLEKSQLDTVMANNPTQPPVNTGSSFVIRDVWNQKAYFQTQIGLNYSIYYSESVLGSGNVDQIEIQFPTTLTTTQKNKVLNEYAKLITLK